MTKTEFLAQFSPENPDHRAAAAKIALQPRIGVKEIWCDAWSEPGVGVLTPGGYYSHNAYECPRAVFGLNGWEWRFGVEYFCD